MRHFIITILFICSTFIANAESATPDCYKEGSLQTLDSKNTKTLKKLVNVGNVQSGFMGYDYPPLPSNFMDIIGGNVSYLCEHIRDANRVSGFWVDLKDKINARYKKGVKDLFYRYVLSIKCRPGALNFYDELTSNPLKVSFVYGNIMRGMFGGINPNAFIRIKREGKLFEGPIHIVYKHLEKHYKNSKHYNREYSGVLKRIARKSYRSEDPKSLEQIKALEPNMPITLPTP